MTFDMTILDWDKSNGLLPAIIQDQRTSSILMLGYMNKDALEQTVQTKQVTFYSRSKRRLWVKGETSGNVLTLMNISMDCDRDTLLISVIPSGSTCHTGSDTCFGERSQSDWNIIQEIDAVIDQREKQRPDNSYLTSLFSAGINRIAQKVGEEGVEVALAAVTETNEKICEEAADLLFHLLVLLKAKKLSLTDVIKVLGVRRSHIMANN